MLRTYCHSSSIFEILENVNDICRLCLEESKDMLSIFNTNEEFYYEKTVFRIMFCVGIEVKKTPNTPQKICRKCYKEVNHIYDFKKKCEKSNRKIRQHLTATDMRENSIKCKESIVNKSYKRIEKESLAKNSNQTDENKLLDSRHVDFSIPTPVSSDYKNSNGSHSTSKTKKEEGRRDIYYSAKDLPRTILRKLKDAGVLQSHNDKLSFKKHDMGLEDVVIQLTTADNSLMTLELSEEGEELIAKSAFNSKTIEKKPEKPIAKIAVKPIKKIPVISIEKKSSDRVNEKFVDRIAEKVSNKAEKVDCDNIQAFRYECDICKKRYPHPRALSRHKQIHSTAKPYKCDICNKSFAVKEVLKKHLAVHLENKPYQCECGRKFSQRSALTSHVRTHMTASDRALKFHPCKHCRKVFLYASGLRRHLQACHMGKMFQCPKCDKPRLYNDRAALLRHYRMAHVGYEPPSLDEMHNNVIIPMKLSLQNKLM